VPTEDCREMARQAGSEVAALEALQHDALRSAVRGYPPRLRNAAYSSIRSLVVRHPAIPFAQLLAFVSEGSHFAAARIIESFYRQIPASAFFGNRARLCGHCGSLLWPDRDTHSYPDGRCRIRQCRLAHPVPARGSDVDAPAEWRGGGAAAGGLWVGEGRALSRAGRGRRGCGWLGYRHRCKNLCQP
jgi:hypothetical protein